MQEFKRVAEASGLRGTELATILEVDRRTIFAWQHDVVPTQPHVVRMVGVTTRALANAIERGLLPFNASVKGAERRRRVQQMAAICRQAAGRA